MYERIQTRLVFKEVGRPLESYADSIELILVVAGALLGVYLLPALTIGPYCGIAHEEAWEKAGVLHRDVSLGNILIDTAEVPGIPNGFLNDWDRCKYKEELEDGVGPSPQTGVSVSANVLYGETYEITLLLGHVGVRICAIPEVSEEA